jgi:predicted Rdx family selenoprotein|tara:strand:- start:431 stop:700 length:270 start_codon:yes stop_codon:yes gene_type:complete
MEQHSIEITYCVPSDYSPRAVSAARDLFSNYQHVISDLRLLTGSKGIYDVRVDREFVYSNDETNRHAEDGDVLEIFRRIVGPDVSVFGT